MISKIGRAKDSWFMKAILILTALSFMSLFGISGYINAGRNKPVIKVDDIVIYQDEIMMQLEQEQRLAKSVFGDAFELNDSIREAMTQGIVQRELENAIIARTAEKLNIHVGDNLVRGIIFSQSEFMDANGNFNVDKLRRLLSMSGWTEARYINSIRKDVVKQNLIHSPLENVNVPKVLLDNLAKLENQQKVFKYVKINPKDMSVDRKISKDELEQYYSDFQVNFMEPEKRDVKFLVIENKDIQAKIVPLEEEIKEYYDANMAQFETPEKRTVLQILVQDEATAQKAFDEIKAGKDFYSVAKDLAKQTKEDTNFGEVSKDMLIADISEDVFEAKSGEVVGPVQSELGWHVLKVVGIKPGTKMNASEAKAKIVKALQAEKAYDEAYGIAKEIDNKVGEGASLDDIAKERGLKIFEVAQLSEDGAAKSMPSAHRSLLKSDDFINNAFSYNVGEVSQIIELDDGYLIMEVTNIQDVHAKDINSVKGEIEKRWIENEKNSIAQEILNDVLADLEHGDDLSEIAGRFGLKVNTTKPLKRSETFEKLPPQEMVELFHEDMGVPRVIRVGDSQIVAVPASVVKTAKVLTDAEKEGIRSALKMDLTQSYKATMINDFAANYDVRVKYRLLGLSNGL